MPGDLIGAYLADLRRRLPAGIVDEIAGGLVDARAHHLALGLSEQDAVSAAVAEFGPARLLAAEFARHAAGRRGARVLLATGPAVGACWGTALIVARAWAWPVPAPARLAFGTALLLAITALVGAATSQRSFRRTRLAAPGAIGLVTLDLTVIGTVLLAAPSITWILAVAIMTSLARTVLAARLIPCIVTC